MVFISVSWVRAAGFHQSFALIHGGISLECHHRMTIPFQHFHDMSIKSYEMMADLSSLQLHLTHVINQRDSND
jgi:hypothetical protein